jgi:hypothetical protein
MSYSELKIAERFKGKLPQEIIEAIQSFNVAFTIQEIGGKYDLLLDQVDELYQLTLGTMVGEIPQNKFPDEVKKIVPDADRETLNNLINSVNDEVFKKLRIFLADKVRPHEPLEIHPQTPPAARAAILKEVEEPSNTPVTESSPQTPVEQKPLVEPVPVNILENKLKGTTSSNVEEKTQSPTPKSYPVDPYREPIQ